MLFPKMIRMNDSNQLEWEVDREMLQVGEWEVDREMLHVGEWEVGGRQGDVAGRGAESGRWTGRCCG